jgi:hypothetical protein
MSNSNLVKIGSAVANLVIGYKADEKRAVKVGPIRVSENLLRRRLLILVSAGLLYLVSPSSAMNLLVQMQILPVSHSPAQEVPNEK